MGWLDRFIKKPAIPVGSPFTNVAEPPCLSVTPPRAQQRDYGESDRRICAWLDQNKRIERYLFTHIAGVTFPNIDGSSRQVTLCRCKPMQLIVLKWERNNPVSETAVAVYLESGEQLGYLPSRLGRETLKRLNKGQIWSGFIISIGVPENSEHEALGATVVLVKLRRTTEAK